MRETLEGFTSIKMPPTGHGKIESKYQFTGFISSGTYGRVYRAKALYGMIGDFAIKKYVIRYRFEWLFTAKSSADLSPTRKASDHILGSRSPLSVRWLFAQN